jgi:septal ring factor EnvC (AmiA/AmiB activator)
MPELSPAVSVFVSLLIAVGGLYLLRIPQAARILSTAFANLSRSQDKRIASQERRIEELENEHADCEKRADALERRIRALERQR